MRFATFLCGLAALAVGALGGCGGTDDGAVETIRGGLTDNVFLLKNYQTNYCMGVANAGTGIGADFVVWTCDGTWNQNFQQRSMTYVPFPYVELINFVAPDRCVMPWWYGNGQNVATYSCESHDAGSNQTWDNWKPIYSFSTVGTDRLSHECYYFESELEPGKVIGVSGGRTDKGAPVVMWDNFNDSVNHPDQLWCVY